MNETKKGFLKGINTINYLLIDLHSSNKLEFLEEYIGCQLTERRFNK